MLTTADAVPFFIQAEVLQPFIDDETLKISQPVFFRGKSGGKGVGHPVSPTSFRGGCQRQTAGQRKESCISCFPMMSVIQHWRSICMRSLR